MPAARGHRRWIESNNVDDYQNGLNNFDVSDVGIYGNPYNEMSDIDLFSGLDRKRFNHPKTSDVVKIKNDRGETVYLKEHELHDILERLLDKVIKEKGFDLYKETQTRLLENIDREVKKIETNTNRYFLDKIDALAEKIAENILNSEIERRVKLKVEKKLSQMKKLLDDE